MAKFDSETAEAQVIWIHEHSAAITDLSRYNIQTKTDDAFSRKVIISTMFISKVKRYDAGLYICQAIYSNAYLSDIKSTDIEVIVQFKPKFIDSPRKTIWLNEEYNEQWEFILDIQCQAIADPPAVFNWFIGNQSVLNDPGVPSFFSVADQDHSSVLIVRLKNLSKFKYYAKELKESSKSIVCKASNTYGNDSLAFDFQFGVPPISPEIIYINFSKGQFIFKLLSSFILNNFFQFNRNRVYILGDKLHGV